MLWRRRGERRLESQVQTGGEDRWEGRGESYRLLSVQKYSRSKRTTHRACNQSEDAQGTSEAMNAARVRDEADGDVSEVLGRR